MPEISRERMLRMASAEPQAIVDLIFYINNDGTESGSANDLTFFSFPPNAYPGREEFFGLLNSQQKKDYVSHSPHTSTVKSYVEVAQENVLMLNTGNKMYNALVEITKTLLDTNLSDETKLSLIFLTLSEGTAPEERNN